jgi:hypothetical protein
MATKAKFDFDKGLNIPEATRGARSSETADKLSAMPEGASFLEPVTVPATVTDAGERDKMFKETARSLTNRMSGAIRRFKAKNDGYDFAIRTVNDDTLGRGVRVWRVKLEKAQAAKTA